MGQIDPDFFFGISIITLASHWNCWFLYFENKRSSLVDSFFFFIFGIAQFIFSRKIPKLSEFVLGHWSQKFRILEKSRFFWPNTHFCKSKSFQTFFQSIELWVFRIYVTHMFQGIFTAYAWNFVWKLTEKLLRWKLWDKNEKKMLSWFLITFHYSHNTLVELPMVYRVPRTEERAFSAATARPRCE